MITVKIPLVDVKKNIDEWEESELYKMGIAGNGLNASDKTFFDENKKKMDSLKINRINDFYTLILSFEQLKSNTVNEIMKKQNLRDTLRPFFIGLKEEMTVDKNTLGDIMSYIEQFVKEVGVTGSWAGMHIKVIKKALEEVESDGDGDAD